MIRVLASLARQRQEYQFTDSQGKNESYETKPLTSYLGSKVDYMYTGQCTLPYWCTLLEATVDCLTLPHGTWTSDRYLSKVGKVINEIMM